MIIFLYILSFRILIYKNNIIKKWNVVSMLRIAKNLLVILSFFTIFICNIKAEVVKYQILIEEENRQIDSTSVTYLKLNNGNPPVISAIMNDDLEITVVNKSLKDMIIHWHGLIVPNNMDGVVDVNMKPIKSGETFVYKFFYCQIICDRLRQARNIHYPTAVDMCIV